MDDVPLGRDTPFEDEFALAKLGVANRIEAYRLARQRGWL